MTTTNTTTTTTALTIGAGAAGTVLAALGARRLLRSPAARFARMGGSSIAAPDAAGWVTDFLNAAYYARPADARAMVLLGPAEMMHFGRKIGMVQILDDSSGAAGAAATHEFSIRRARTVNTFPDAK